MCKDYNSEDNPQIESNSVAVGKMTDICETAPDTASPCGWESMIDWMELWQVEMDSWLKEYHTMQMHVLQFDKSTLGAGGC